MRKAASHLNSAVNTHFNSNDENSADSMSICQDQPASSSFLNPPRDGVDMFKSGFTYFDHQQQHCPDSYVFEAEWNISNSLNTPAFDMDEDYDIEKYIQKTTQQQ